MTHIVLAHPTSHVTLQKVVTDKTLSVLLEEALSLPADQLQATPAGLGQCQVLGIVITSDVRPVSLNLHNWSTGDIVILTDPRYSEVFYFKVTSVKS